MSASSCSDKSILYLDVDVDCSPSGKRSLMARIIFFDSSSDFFHNTMRTRPETKETAVIITKISNMRLEEIVVEKRTIAKEQHIESNDNPNVKYIDDELPRSKIFNSVSFTKYTITLCVFGAMISEVNC